MMSGLLDENALATLDGDTGPGITAWCRGVKRPCICGHGETRHGERGAGSACGFLTCDCPAYRPALCPTGGDAPRLAKHQPCGCVVCTCKTEERCLGCGAKHCGTHPVGAIPNPMYESGGDASATCSCGHSGTSHLPKCACGCGRVR